MIILNHHDDNILLSVFKKKNLYGIIFYGILMSLMKLLVCAKETVKKDEKKKANKVNY